MSTKTISSVEKKIESTKLRLVRLKERYDEAASELVKLQKELEALQLQKVGRAFKKSRKTFQELMTFLEQ